ncbi:MAG: hypothetical protein HON76_19460 [Candidatus Scalindua sp.]|jgi:hypothetical protein|nr:hypothetical protein [Candidatus Scalindua sp.]MBT5304672.1 hypothetical protein [Candidatus Scalindua sp.]MBT6052108.1 hypothetical protein [Candidatus Scalindua sp.]MBT6227660.1 hypothetical protein [Candidatus Scalindua sp.]MBT6564697.1 hypothetical protein [Candidatus Scalindua sp.]
MYKHIKLIVVVFCLGLFLSGTNTYAGKTIDWHSFVSDTSNLVVIKGKIRSIDLYKMEIILDGCALLGDEPLKLSGETTYYLESKDADINSIKGEARVTEDDKINYYELEVGHTIKCNYEIKDGEVWALRIIRIFPHVQQILF